MDPLVLLVHAAVTWFLAGLIWVVQLVHYPLFDAVDRATFPAFEQRHSHRITWIVAPAMALELITAAWLLVSTSPSAPAWGALVAGGALVLVNWASTAFVQVPCHHALARGWDAAVHARLVRSNWMRTVAWTLRAGLAVSLCRSALA